MKRREAWWTAVLVGWAATTLALGLLIAATATQYTLALIVQQAVVAAAVPCVLVGGPAAAVALRFADRQGLSPARLRGWLVGAGGVVAIVAAAVAAGAGISVTVVLVALAVTAAEVAFAVRLYRQSGAHLSAG